MDDERNLDNLDNVDEDDPTKVDLDDDGNDELDEDEDEEVDFGKLAPDDDLEDEADEDPEEEPKPKAKEPAKKPAATKEPDKEPDKVPEGMLTKAQVEQIVQERLNRDPYRSIGRRLEQKTGMTLQQLDEYADRQQEEEAVNKLVEENYMTEEDARRKVREDRENQTLRQEVPQIRQQLSEYQSMLNYNNDKARDMSNPYVRKYEKEIDTFSQGGKACSFESAKKYILGEKLLSGDLGEAIKSGAINKTLADISKQSKVKVQKGSQSGRSRADMDSDEIDPFQKQIAAQMGVSLKEVRAEKAKISKERRTGRM